MRALLGWARRVFGSITGGRRDRDFAAELDSHLQLHVDDNLRAGMTPAEARRRALIALGGVEQAKEQHRDRRGVPWLSGSLKDLHYAFRGLLRTPGFTIAAVLTLGIGIGVHTAVFSVVDGLLFRPLPFRDTERLVQITSSYLNRPGSWSPSIDVARLDVLGQHTDVFEAITNYRISGRSVLAETGGEITRTSRVAPGFFRFLGVQPVMGREFDPSESESAVAIVTHQFWRRVFAADPQALGRTVTLDGRAFTVIGVMPPEVQFPVNDSVQIWTPQPPQGSGTGMARLRPGIPLEEAQRRADLLSARLQEQAPVKDPRGYRLKSESDVRMPRGAVVIFLLLLSAVGLVVLIASANVATLFLSRTAGRMKELGVRAALGASRGRLMRHVLLEALIVAALGGALAVLMSATILDAAQVMLPPEVGSLGYPELNYRVILFAAAVVLGSTVLCALGPTLRARRADFSQLLGTSHHASTIRRGDRRLYQRLVAFELGLTFVLLLGTGLLTNSFVRQVAVDTGFEPRNLAVVNVLVSSEKYSTTEIARQKLEEVVRRVRLVPGVTAVTLGGTVPPQGGVTYEVDVDAEKDATRTTAEFTPVERNYFQVLQIPVRTGRPFGDTDGPAGDDVLVVNESLARHYWPSESAVGKRLRLGASRWVTVVGVVGDVKGSNFSKGTDQFKAYLPWLRDGNVRLWMLAARTASAPEAVVQQIRRAIHDIDPSAVRSATTGEGAYGTLLLAPRLSLGLMSVFSGGALFLALIGIYGLVSSSVAHRKQEMGIRIALGASAGAIKRMVVREALRPAVIGLAFGLVAGLTATTFARHLLFEVSPHDPLTIVAVAAVLMAAVAAVAWIPAHRATKLDPIQTLRVE